MVHIVLKKELKKKTQFLHSVTVFGKVLAMKYLLEKGMMEYQHFHIVSTTNALERCRVLF